MNRYMSILVKLSTLLFLAGNTLLLILIIISGSTNDYPINNFYWVEADTANIPNAPDVTRWTFWGACGVENGDETNCGSNLSPAAPISPVDNFHTTINVPSKFVNDRNTFYYLTRFSFCLFWISLAFIGITFLLYIISWFSYEFTKVCFLLVSIGCLFNVTGVVLQTAASVLARNAFNKTGVNHSKLGSDLFGIAWASVALSLLEAIALAVTHINNVYQRRSNNSISQVNDVYDPIYGTAQRRSNSYTTNSRGFKKFFTISRKNRTTSQQLNNQQIPNPPMHTDEYIAEQPLQEHQRKGINFFTIRNTKSKSTIDDSV
ncbi:hypothetical protein TPHA_0O00560 [Tetrapisispora phaffii CBS 4417]|uniref:Protein SUR7 n=1 Tax=Tetrapisispora phaffii (strain ATCC 24235 / CBS 4417 / NBRC 1672 / NRRL Y-8282 / UCD 70-5) TaxID=1071381 RepID=G8C1J8_TETPH|nr:hypothetical protein TPHA_0O00560 [Tetrapisispora phaffii CBS 4417]CCE66026.1 hypothetical protein TPHA_0O00560 [Tetrapisispora phaffii CBS 4417]